MPPNLRSRRETNDASTSVPGLSGTNTAKAPRLKLSMKEPVPQKPSAVTKKKPVALRLSAAAKKQVKSGPITTKTKLVSSETAVAENQAPQKPNTAGKK